MLVEKHATSPPLLPNKTQNVTLIPATTQTHNNNNNNNHNNNHQPVYQTTISLEKCQQQQHNACQASTQHSDAKSLHDLLLETLDILVSCLVVAPCVISYWRGTWELMGVLIFPNNVPLSALFSFLIGGFGHLLFTMAQTYFRDHVHPDKRRLTYYLVSRCYTAVFGIVCVNMWRGSWILCDWLTSADSLVIITIVTLVAVIFLIATRTVRNLGAAPYTVTMDHKSDYFDVGTMFQIPGFHQPGLYLLDSLFSIFVIGTLVVIAWRGLWGIMDLTLFVEDKAKSAWGSLLIGYSTVFVSFIIHPLLRLICRYVDGVCKLIVCDIFYFMAFFGAVNAWRGIWMLLDLYLYPDNRILSFWLTHVIPFLILAALKCSNSILVRGVFIDAEGHDGECIDIPINYIRLHFQRERVKKQHSMRYYNKHQQQQIYPYRAHEGKQHHHLTKNMELEAHTAFIEKPLKRNATEPQTATKAKSDVQLV